MGLFGGASLTRTVQFSPRSNPENTQGIQWPSGQLKIIHVPGSFQCKDRGRQQRKRVGKRLIKSQVVSRKTSGTEEKQHKGNRIKRKDSRNYTKKKKKRKVGKEAFCGY